MPLSTGVVLSDALFLFPHPTRCRNPSPVPQVSWDTTQKETGESWKGTVACVFLGVLFAVTIGLVYWQVVDHSHKTWILKGQFSELLWDRRSHNLLVQTPAADKTYLNIDVGDLANPEVGAPFVRNLCWLNRTSFCYIWESQVDVRISLDPGDSQHSECYNVTWGPLHCHVEVKVSWPFHQQAVVIQLCRLFCQNTWPISLNSSNSVT